MTLFRKILTTASFLLTTFSIQVQAQGQMSAQEQANLQLVDEWWRTVLQGGRLNMADQYMAPDYTQHNPGINTGRDGFIEFFSRFAQESPIPESITPPPVIQFAKGDYVVFVWERQGTDPNTGEMYPYNFFDVVRVENGMVQEHWDSAFRNAPPPGAPVTPINTGIGPVPVAPTNYSAEELANIELANIEMKDILQYGHVELAEEVMAADYIQHNPNVPGGRDGFVDFFSRFANPQPIQEAWVDEPELIIASGDIVLYQMVRYSQDPARNNEVYKWNWYDMLRIEDGMIQEHWDMATRDNNVPGRVAPPAGFVSYSNR